jgi:hypothetical protein
MYRKITDRFFSEKHCPILLVQIAASIGTAAASIGTEV